VTFGLTLLLHDRLQQLIGRRTYALDDHNSQDYTTSASMDALLLHRQTVQQKQQSSSNITGRSTSGGLHTSSRNWTSCCQHEDVMCKADEAAFDSLDMQSHHVVLSKQNCEGNQRFTTDLSW
jgi:hypothetical protein